jgi:hypothetical protein
MQKIVLCIGGKTFKSFESLSQLVVYGLDCALKIVIVCLFITLGISHEVVISSNPQLSSFVLLYISAIIVWGLLLAKFIFLGKTTLGKTRFDLFFMGMLTFFLLSVLMSPDKVRGVFGSFGTWQISVMTFLSVSIIYYVSALLFCYKKGMKWFISFFLFSLFIPALYYIVGVLQAYKASSDFVKYGLLAVPLALIPFALFKNIRLKVISFLLSLFVVYFVISHFPHIAGQSSDFLIYSVISLPFSITCLFVFRRLFLKIICFDTLLFNLFLIAYYSSFLQSGLFILSCGVASLFILFYLSFWIKNSFTVINFVKKIFLKIQRREKLLPLMQERKRAFIITLMLFFMALWIIGFIFFNGQYYKTNIGPYIGTWIHEDISKMNGIKMWIIGNTDLSKEFSSLEVLNILGNYGIVGVSLFLGFLMYSSFISGKVTLKLLYMGSFKNTLLGASIFISSMSILITALLSRFSPMIFLLLIWLTALLNIIESIISRKNLYQLEKAKEVKWKVRIVQLLACILILVLVIVGTGGILSGVEKGTFWVGQ